MPRSRPRRVEPKDPPRDLFSDEELVCDPLFYEGRARSSGFTCIAGLDEAGRGPLAGPVVAAAVVLPEGLLIPGLTDSEAPAIAQAAAEAGASFAGYVALRLPFAVKSLFEEWLEQHFPDRKEKVLNRIRSIRGGKLNDPNFRTRMHGEGIFAQQMAELFQIACKKAGISKRWPTFTTKYFRRPGNRQLSLFETGCSGMHHGQT